MANINKENFKKTYKDDWKDRIQTELFDTKDKDGKAWPQWKFQRWDNEVNYSLRLKESDIEEPVIVEEDGKTKWKKSKHEVHFYEKPELVEGGYEIEVILNEKPIINKWEFSIETKGLRFSYQPKFNTLTIPSGYYADETHIWNGDGDITNSTTEDNVDSYVAWYIDSPANIEGGKVYRQGKAFQVHRIKAVDSVGNWVWGTQNIDVKNKLHIIEISQEFLNNAQYPVTIDPTFGYDTGGGARQWSSANQLYTTGPYVAPEGVTGSTIQKMTAQGYEDRSGDLYCKIVILNNSTHAIISNAVTNGSLMPAGSENKAWVDFTFSSAPSLTDSTSYNFGQIADSGSANLGICYDNDAGFMEWRDTSNNYTTPTDPTDGATSYTEKYSIYVTYASEVSALTPSVYDSITVSENVSLVISPVDSRGDYASLPADSAELETAFTQTDYADVSSDNATRVAQTADGQYAVMQFKYYAGSKTAVSVAWNGQSDKAPSSATVYLQVYDVNGASWSTLASNNAANADTDFNLTGTITDLTNYKSTTGVVACRVYQQSS